jgi:hypothetical protein
VSEGSSTTYALLTAFLANDWDAYDDVWRSLGITDEQAAGELGHVLDHLVAYAQLLVTRNAAAAQVTPERCLQEWGLRAAQGRLHLPPEAQGPLRWQPPS